MDSLARTAFLACLLGSAGRVSEAAEQAPPAEAPHATLILKGGVLATLDPARPAAEAIAMRGDRIVAVGADRDMIEWLGPETEVLDLEGRFAMPGFIEGHAHLLGLGQLRMELDLTAAQSWDEVVALVADRARQTPRGEWIIGRGWHQSLWKAPPTPNVEGYPTHDALSAAAGEHAVLLVHRSGHAAIANARALALAKIGDDTPPPRGGELLHGADGRLTGVLRETAQGLVTQAIERSRADLSPAERQTLFERQVALATRECLAKGVTSLHDAGSNFADVGRLVELAERGRLDLRLWIMLRASNDELAQRLPKAALLRGVAGHRLTVGGIKRLIDGALGSHGAWLIEPYADLPASRGLSLASTDDLWRTAELARQHDLQLCIHAIGDRANREVLDLYERFFAAFPDAADRRWRIEHAQQLSPPDVQRFARLGVVASMQAVHCTSDAAFVVDRLGIERAAKGAYVWQPLLRAGAVVINGTDAPVEDVDPIKSFYASVTRRTANGERFFPEHVMTREQALRSYTLDAAYAAREEHVKGSLAVGKLADVVVLDRNLLTVADDDIPSTRVEFTILGGRIVYRAAAVADSANGAAKGY